MAREMTVQEERWLKHAVGGDKLVGHFLRTQSQAYKSPMHRAMKQPVCIKCERLAFYHKDGIACPTCGYIGSAEKIKMKLYLQGGAYR